ncbi:MULTISPECIES: hypothetical protein [Actinomadura]|uniref:Lipoprotein n=1 Tax=Actinomadura yumaensis TaxID=111807 RepID=A0ABW2CHS1_9ACTN|nr:hypothetical protein [Actinomadura sp. J1-007]MWK32973.1 hypothetical protein [Actinomadura sp. J1-007]
MRGLRHAWTAAAGLVLLGAAAGAAGAGCGIQPTGIVTAGDGPPASGQAGPMTVFLVGPDGRLASTVRPGLPGHPYAAVSQLAIPPTSGERRRGLTTAVPEPLRLSARSSPTQGGPTGGVLDVDVRLDVRLDAKDAVAELRKRQPLWSRRAQAQVACTAETIPGVTKVRLTGLVSFKPGPRTRPGMDNSVWVTGLLGADLREWEDLGCSDFPDLRPAAPRAP